MNILLITALVLSAAMGTVVILLQDLIRQVIALGVFGLILAVLFILYNAPDVAMAQVIINGVVIPLLVMMAIAKTRREDK